MLGAIPICGKKTQQPFKALPVVCRREAKDTGQWCKRLDFPGVSRRLSNPSFCRLSVVLSRNRRSTMTSKNMISLTRDRTMKRGAVASRRVRDVLAAKSLPALGLALASAGLWVAAPSLAQGIDLSPSAWVFDESPLTDEELAAVLPTGMTLEEFKRGMEAWAPGSVASLQPSAPKNGAAGAVGGEHGHSSDSPKVNASSSESPVGDASVGGGGGGSNSRHENGGSSVGNGKGGAEGSASGPGAVAGTAPDGAKHSDSGPSGGAPVSPGVAPGPGAGVAPGMGASGSAGEAHSPPNEKVPSEGGQGKGPGGGTGGADGSPVPGSGGGGSVPSGAVGGDSPPEPPSTGGKPGGGDQPAQKDEGNANGQAPDGAMDPVPPRDGDAGAQPPGGGADPDRPEGGGGDGAVPNLPEAGGNGPRPPAGNRGRYRGNGVGASLELGKRFTWPGAWYVEPQLEVAAFHAQGADYTASNGLRIKDDGTNSMLGRVGLHVGRQFDLGDGRVVQPYMKLSWVQEFDGKGTVRTNDIRHKVRLDGGRTELAVGVASQLGKHGSLFGSYEYAKGSRQTMPWTFHIGYRYAW
ncbi:autotransporter [Bordetella bronchiseptica MO211]|nr:autotransporter [Bordetella bronchiseptica MO211]